MFLQILIISPPVTFAPSAQTPYPFSTLCTYTRLHADKCLKKLKYVNLLVICRFSYQITLRPARSIIFHFPLVATSGFVVSCFCSIPLNVFFIDNLLILKFIYPLFFINSNQISRICCFLNHCLNYSSSPPLPSCLSCPSPHPHPPASVRRLLAPSRSASSSCGYPSISCAP